MTKDEDFLDLQTLHGYPPKLVILRLGNCSNQRVLDVLLNSVDKLSALLSQDTIGVVEIA